jgi:thioredoxin 1
MVRSIALLAVAAPAATAFSSTPFMGSRVAAPSSTSTLSMRVVDIDSTDAFDKTIESAGGALVVVDYSTTWCGPCKVIAPKFDELSDQYSDAVFLKVSVKGS